MIDVSADPGSRAWRGVRPSAEKTGPVSPRRVAFSLREDSGHKHHDSDSSLFLPHCSVWTSNPCICCRAVPLNALFATSLRNPFTISRVGSPAFWVVAAVQSLSHIRLFVTPWAVACQASLSFTISQSLFKLTYFWVGDGISPVLYLFSRRMPAFGGACLGDFFLEFIHSRKKPSSSLVHKDSLAKYGILEQHHFSSEFWRKGSIPSWFRSYC